MSRLFFEGNPDLKGSRLRPKTQADVQHELFYEDELTSIRHRPLHVGQAFSNWRFIVAFIVPVLLLFCLAVRAFSMQVVDGSSYRALADNNRLRETPIWPKRGIIQDRNGVTLTENQPRFQLVLYASELPKNEETKAEVLATVARLLGQPLASIQAEVASIQTGDDQIFLADQLPYEQAMRFATSLPQLPGLHLEIRSKRKYPESAKTESLSPILGYVGKLSQTEYDANKGKGYLHADEIGKVGVERSYESVLRGTVGQDVAEVDARGQIKGAVGQTPAVDGQDLKLNIDLELQKKAEQALQTELRTIHRTRGAVVAMDPRDGSVLALVSLPAYDDNLFAGGVSSTVYQALISNPDQPLFPRAWAGMYPSGSTVKIVVSLAALEEKVITAATTVLSTGGLRVGQWFFPDWKAGGHGITNVRRAIAWSVNSFFYTVGGGYGSFTGLGIDRLSGWMRKFGLGQKSGLDIPGEAAGFVPSPDWKERTKDTNWYVGDTYNLSIGQGDLLVTPVQVATYTSAIANGGTLYTPHVVKSVGTGSDQHSVASVVRASHLGSDANVTTVRLGMRDCVVSGSCRGIADLPFTTGAKTGTAQWHQDRDTHAWFTSFAPFDKPEIVVTVLIEEGGEGSSVSVPVAKQVLQEWWDLRTRRQGAF